MKKLLIALVLVLALASPSWAIQAAFNYEIESIQLVEFSFARTNNDPAGADEDQTITAVNTSNTIILPGILQEAASGAYLEYTFSLPNSTTVRMHHASDTTTAGAVTASVYVVEFRTGVITSSQIVTDASDPQTITSVDTDKAVFFPRSFKSYWFSPPGPAGADIDSATSLDWASISLTWSDAYGQVVEFK
jgi:hypothetical protein